jgi:hypothetical protein
LTINRKGLKRKRQGSNGNGSTRKGTEKAPFSRLSDVDVLATQKGNMHVRTSVYPPCLTRKRLQDSI